MEEDEDGLEDRLNIVQFDIWRRNAPFLYGELRSVFGTH